MRSAHALPALLALATAGCAALSPGLHLSEDRISERGTADQPAIRPITPALLAVQHEARRAREAAPRPGDPMAAEAGRYEYRIAPHDVLQVTVWEHPELTNPVGEFRSLESAGNLVQADGTVFYPHVGTLAVAGRTVVDVRSELTARLRKYVESPQLDVRVAAFRGRKVQVTGEVVTPSTVPVTDVPLRVQDAIAAAKGPTPDAWLREVTLTRGDQVHRLDLQALYEGGDPTQNWLLQDGDLVHVPSRQQNKVFVMGEVRKPSSRVMAKGSMSLAEAINDSEGFDPLTSNPGAVYVLRGRYEQPTVYRLDASSADALLLAVQFQLEPLDVVYVTPYSLTSWNRVVQQILPTAQALWFAVDMANQTKLIPAP